MKKLLFFLVVSLLLSYSLVWGENIPSSDETVHVTIDLMENAEEEDYDGIWVPTLMYVRAFESTVPVDERFANDLVIVSDKSIHITLLGNSFYDLPYEFDDGAVYTSVNSAYTSLQLINENSLLYTIHMDKDHAAEFICFRFGYLLSLQEETE